MTRFTTTSILATALLALTLASGPAMSQARGGGGSGPGGGGPSGDGGYSRVVPGGPCIASCYRRPRLTRIEEKPPEYTCGVWHRLVWAGNPRCAEPEPQG